MQPPPVTPPTTVRAAVSLAQVPGAGAAPLLLRVGQRLLAEVISVNGQSGRVLFSMAGRRFTAQAPLPLAAGEVLQVAVAEVSAESLVLRLVPGDAGTAASAGSGSPVLNPAAILADLALPATPELTAAVEALLERGRPLTRADLLAVRAAVAGQPSPVESARAAVYLQQLGLPLTPRALQLARSVLAESPPRPLANVLSELLDAGADPQLRGLAVDTPEPDVLRQAVTLLAEGPEAALAQGPIEQSTPKVADTPPSAAVARGQGSQPGTASRAGTVPRSDAPAADAEASDPFAASPALPSARTLLSGAAGNRDLPAAVRALAQTLHDRIELQQLANAAAAARAGDAPPANTDGPSARVTLLPAAGAAPAAAAPTGAAGTAGSPTQPSALTLAISIPLIIAGQMTTLDLAIQRDPPSRHHGSDPATAPVRTQLALRLPHLGEVGIDLRLVGDALRCRLTLRNDAARTALDDAASELRRRWEAAGFRVEALECVAANPSPEAPARPHRVHHVDLDA